LVFWAVFVTVSVVTGCKTTPPVEEEAPQPLPPAEETLPEKTEKTEEKKEDTSPPIISVTLSPQRFSPDGDGENDEMTVTIDVQSASEVTGWNIRIREPMSQHLLFSEWSDDGMPPESLIWDGRSASGELVQSATTYHYELSVSNLYDQATYQGTFSVDFLVRRDGDDLRIMVPSIVFASNSGQFLMNVAPESAENNATILMRIADILNSPEFISYRIKVEGHANPTTPPGTAARTIEERGTSTEIGLRSLSEIRAKSVVDFLARNGVSRSRLTPIGRGGTRAIYDFDDTENSWKNRRVEFILESR
jgi:outer membrane protein OmpA-like peptidoglycan-associated protein